MAGYKILGLADQKSPQSQYKIVGEEQLSPEQEADEAGAALDNLPQPEGFWSKLPRNILIGLTHAGRNLHNAPHDIVQGLEHVAAPFANNPLDKILEEKYGLKQKKSKPISEYLPYDEQDYSDVFGGNKDTKTLGDKLVQGAIEHGPELVGAGGLVRSGLRRFPITQRGAARQLRQAEHLASERGVNIPLTNQSIDEAVPFLPRTHATRELLQGAEAGEYGPSFGLQSQVGKHERDLRKSALASERLLAPQARELKQRIIGEMETGLRAMGHNDIADLLKGGLNDYRKYIKFRDDVKPYLTKLGIPGSALALLGVGVKYGKKAANALND